MTWLDRRFGGLSRPFWLLFFGVGAVRLGFFVIPFRVYFLAHERHLSVVDSSLVMTAFGAGWALSQPVGGWFADRIGRRAVIIAGAWGSAAAFLAFGSVTNFTWLAISACAAGMTFDVYRPAVQALAADSVSPDRRSQALALLYLVMNIGRGVACVLAGLLAEQAFWSLFVINAVVNVVFGLVVLRMSSPPTVKSSGMSVALRDPRLITFTLITLVWFCVHTQSVVTLPAVMDQAGASPLAFGLILAMDPLVVAAAQLLLQDRLLRPNPFLVCGIGAATVGIGLAITGMGTSVAWFAATSPIWIVGEVAFLTVAPGIVATMAPEHLRGVYFGVWGGAQGLSAVLAPIIASVLIRNGGTDLLWLSGAGAGVVVALACVIMRPAGLLDRWLPSSRSEPSPQRSLVHTKS